MSIARSRPPRPLRRSSRMPTAALPASSVQLNNGELRESIATLTDEHGMPRAGQIDRALAVLESWTRRLEAELDVGPTEQERYRKFVEGLLRLARRDGSIVLGDQE